MDYLFVLIAVVLSANGYIDQEEFKSMMAERFIEDRLKKMYTRAAFQMLDKNNDGFITSEEINQVGAFLYTLTKKRF